MEEGEKPVLPYKPEGYSSNGWEENQLISVINLRHFWVPCNAVWFRLYML